MHHYGEAPFNNWWLALWAIVLAVPIILAAAFFITEAGADGGHGACDGGTISIGGSADLVTYDASPSIIDGVCVKAGNTVQHTYFTQDVNTGCYNIVGIGTSVVTVTRLGEGRECQGLSHIDVTTDTPTSTPTPTPTPPATPTATPIPTPTPTGTSTSIAPIALPNSGGGPGGLPNDGIGWGLLALGLVLMSGGGLALYIAGFLLRRE